MESEPINLTRDKLEHGLKEFISSVRVDESRIFWNDIQCAFIAETIPGVLYKGMMSSLGSLAKSYFFSFLVIPGFIVVSKLIGQGYSPEEALERYAWLFSVGGRGVAELVEADLEKPEVIVRIHNPAVTAWFKRNFKNVKAIFPFYDCAWWGYNWVGAVDAALRKKASWKHLLTYDESKCFVDESRYCEFYVEKLHESNATQHNLMKKEIIDEYVSTIDAKKNDVVANVASPPSALEDAIRGFLGRLEVRDDCSIGIGKERILLEEGYMYSLAQMLLPVELFGGVVYGSYMRAHVDYGRTLARQGERYGVERVVEFFFNSASSMGWGDLELVEFGDSRVVFRTYQSIYGEEAVVYLMKRRIARPACTYGWIVEGILNYFAELEGKPLFTSKEVRCIGKGDSYCEFVLGR